LQLTTILWVMTVRSASHAHDMMDTEAPRRWKSTSPAAATAEPAHIKITELHTTGERLSMPQAARRKDVRTGVRFFNICAKDTLRNRYAIWPRVSAAAVLTPTTPMFMM